MAFHATFDTIFIAVGLVTVLRGAVTDFARGVTRFSRLYDLRIINSTAVSKIFSPFVICFIIT